MIPSFYFWDRTCTCSYSHTLQHLFLTPISVLQMQFQSWFHFWSSCWSILGSILGLNSAPKLVQQRLMSGTILSNPIFWGFETLQVPLGSLPEPPVIVLGASKTRKVWFWHWNFLLVVNAVFHFFEALDVFLGFILAPLGLLRTQSGPKMVQKLDPKSTNISSTNCQNVDAMFNIFWACFGRWLEAQNPIGQITQAGFPDTVRP